MDFFAYPDAEKFSTAIGNPPYVRFREILLATRKLLKASLLDGRANLYLYFIEKTVRHLMPGGELIFITPRDFLKTTASVRLNSWLHERGTITHVIELGDSRVFASASPNCLIWRYEKDDFSRKTRYAQVGVKDDLVTALSQPAWEERLFLESSGHLLFPKHQPGSLLCDIASVKVGAVSGANDIYVDAVHGNREFVFSETQKTGRTRAMIWTEPGQPAPDVLIPHRDRLITRDIRPFNDENWWHWGRGYPLTDAPRIYVNSITRAAKPFFLNDSKHFDGSLLAIFPHDPHADLEKLCDALNSVEWGALGFVCDGRIRFSQRSLEHAPLPVSFWG